MFKSCLVCTDFTDGLQKLVYFVNSLVKGGLQEIVFLHSVPLWEEGEVPRIDRDKIEEFENALSPALENVPDGVTVKVEVPSGEPLETITKAVKKYSSNFVILATPLRSSWQDKLFGCTTMGLTKSIDIPLMIFRPQLISVYTEEELASRCRNLSSSFLIPYNDSDAAHYLIDRIKYYIKNKPENVSTSLSLIWVVDEVSRSEILSKHHLEEARVKLNKIKADLEKLGVEVRAKVKTGNPLNEVLDLAFEEDISAIAIAADREEGLLQWTVPSFAQELLHRSWFPLLFFTKKK